MNIRKVLLPGFKDVFSGFAAVPELMTIAVDGVEVVSTTARGTASGLSTRAANFSAKAFLASSGMYGENSSNTSRWESTTGDLATPSPSMALGGTSWAPVGGEDLPIMAAQGDWLRLVGDSHVPSFLAAASLVHPAGPS